MIVMANLRSFELLLLLLSLARDLKMLAMVSMERVMFKELATIGLTSVIQKMYVFELPIKTQALLSTVVLVCGSKLAVTMSSL